MGGNIAILEDVSREDSVVDASVPTVPFQKLSPAKIEVIVLEHRDHGRRLAWSFLTTWRIRMKQDEVISIVGAALCEAANRFDENRGVAFKTFFFYHLRGMLLKEISRMIHEQRVLQYYPNSLLGDSQATEQGAYSSPAIVPVEQNNPEKLLEKMEVSRMTWDACSQLDTLEQEVIVRHFVYDQSLIDIAEELGYCRCHISRVKSRGLSKLQKNLKRSMFRNDADPDLDLSPETRAALETARKNYTGGRGRRRTQAAELKSTPLRKIA